MESQSGHDAATSMSLLARVEKSDDAAWSKLVKLYGPLVYTWARAAGVSEHDASDVMQDVFRSVFTSIGRFKKECATHRFRDWLWTITRRRVTDRQRKEFGLPQGEGGTEANLFVQELPDAIPSGEEDPSVALSNHAQLVRRAMEFVRCEFEEKTWQACARTSIDGESPQAVAESLGLSVGAVYVARSRVLKRLREELQDLL